MPELPDVEIFGRVVEQNCLDRVVARAVVADPGSLEGATAATLQRRLKGRRLASCRRHGKVLFVGFEDAGTLAMHFGTNGSLQHVPRDADEPAYARMLFEFDAGDRLAYLNPRRIGHVCVTDSAAAFIAAQRLGPDALDAAFDAKAFDCVDREPQAGDQGRADGSGADRRDRQHLCRRDPVPGQAASRHARRTGWTPACGTVCSTR